MKQLYWFVDTRKEESEPFAIHNKDVAKSWKNEHAMGEGPFKAVEGPEVVEDQKDPEGENGPETGSGEATDVENDPSPYDDMTNDELKAELDARLIDYKSKATKPELIKLLVEDDGNGGE
jgi:hypothetical protein